MEGARKSNAWRTRPRSHSKNQSKLLYMHGTILLFLFHLALFLNSMLLRSRTFFSILDKVITKREICGRHHSSKFKPRFMIPETIVLGFLSSLYPEQIYRKATSPRTYRAVIDHQTACSLHTRFVTRNYDVLLTDRHHAPSGQSRAEFQSERKP